MGDQKGFILLGVLVFMLFFVSIFSVFYTTAGRYISVLNDYQYVYDRLELEHTIISRINQEFFDFDNKDFNLDINENHVVVEYSDLIAKIVVINGYEFTSCLYYNDHYGTIDDYQYKSECNEIVVK